MAKRPFGVGLGGTFKGYGSLSTQAQQGMNGVLGRLNKFLDWVGSDVVAEAMSDALEPTMELSDHYAPKDTHTMVNSRYNVVRKRGRAMRAEVGYNRNGEAPYTVLVHEMPQFFHEPPTQYKFLQRAMDEDTPELVGRVAAGIKRRTGL